MQPPFPQDNYPLPTPRGLLNQGSLQTWPPARGKVCPLHLLSSPEDLGGDDEAGSSAEREKEGCYWA